MTYEHDYSSSIFTNKKQQPMSTLELKGRMYELISKINDEEVLIKLYEMIGEVITQNLEKTDFGDELTEQQQTELELAIQESYDESKLTAHHIVVEKYSKWLDR
jgi:hypothetical protein